MTPLPAAVVAAVTAALGAPPSTLQPLAGGCVGEVYALQASDRDSVLKLDRHGSGLLPREARMLDWLARHTALPVPRVLACNTQFLLMTRLPADGRGGARIETEAADHLAALHGIGAPRYGFDFDTALGGLPQANPWHEDWHTFFAEHRLCAMARLAHTAGQLPATLRDGVERLAGHLDRWLGPAQPPGLVHGDLWSGNVLLHRGHISGFIDPAIHFADPEVELAFITLFSTFGEHFFARYREQRPLSPDFHELRRPLYNLYPLLVHARLFGGHYVQSVAQTLRRFG